jgi:hypothetical protein
MQVIHAGELVATGSIRVLREDECHPPVPIQLAPRPTFRAVLESQTQSVHGDAATPLTVTRSESILASHSDLLPSPRFGLLSERVAPKPALKTCICRASRPYFDAGRNDCRLAKVKWDSSQIVMKLL